MSDGSPTLYFRDPQTFALTGSVSVRDTRNFRNNLNELEWIEGEVWANIWLTDFIARIDPVTGHVNSWLDLTGLLRPEEGAAANVLNGVAYDAATGRISVTGKYWPKLFEIEVLPAE